MEKILSIILNEENIQLFMTYIAILTPVIGIPIGLILGKMKKDIPFFTVWGFIIGMIGPGILLLWLLYNRITESLGLDTVKNLLVNMAVFVGIGLILGIIISKAPRRKKAELLQNDSIETGK